MTKLKKLFNTLKKRKKTLAVCESITGGYVSFLLTKNPGASQIFQLGLVAYSLKSKNKFFKIPKEELEETQGVSQNIAKILAEKVRKFLNSDIGASIVGFAGPKAKKGMKGVVFMGFSDKNKTVTKKTKFKGSRDSIRKKASSAFIDFILENLE